MLGIDPEAGHMGGTSHNECFFYKMLTAVYWYWEVVKRSSGLWPLLLAVLLIASLVARSVTLAGLRVTWLRRRAPLGSTILTGNTVGTPASDCSIGVHSAQCALELRIIGALSELGTLPP